MVVWSFVFLAIVLGGGLYYSVYRLRKMRKGYSEATAIYEERLIAKNKEVSEIKSQLAACDAENNKLLKKDHDQLTQILDLQQRLEREISKNAELAKLEGYKINNEEITNQNRLHIKNLVRFSSERVRSKKSSSKKSRQLVFLHQSYYHFYYLASALRRRGWNAQLVTIDRPGDIWNKYYHGFDINLYHPDAQKQQNQIVEYLAYVKSNIDIVHFAGDGCMSFFPERYGNNNLGLSTDFDELKKHGIKIGYTISGCNSGVRKETVRKWSLLGGEPVCSKCRWNTEAEICNAQKSDDWGKLVKENCDLIAAEVSPALDHLCSRNVLFEPLTMCMDPILMSPDILVPRDKRIDRRENKVLIYHGCGEYDNRTHGEVNIKGTNAIFAAVEKLKDEGLNVELVFASGIENSEVKYLQVQADIIVDQLNYGRYGAQAREGLMLGKPVICYLNRRELNAGYRSVALDECPIISANENSVYECLKELVLSQKLRNEIGVKSRQYALKWHSSDRCAARYEYVVDTFLSDGEFDSSKFDIEQYVNAQ